MPPTKLLWVTAADVAVFASIQLPSAHRTNASIRLQRVPDCLAMLFVLHVVSKYGITRIPAELLGAAGVIVAATWTTLCWAVEDLGPSDGSLTGQISIGPFYRFALEGRNGSWSIVRLADALENLGNVLFSGQPPQRSEEGG